MTTTSKSCVRLGLLAVALAVVAPHARTQSSAQTPAPTSSSRAMLNAYCVSCHSQRLATAGLSLDNVDVERVREAPALWEKVVRKLRAGAMPPPGQRRPEAAVLNAFVETLERDLDRAVEEHPNPGRPAVHRLNRTEYSNAVRDLLGLHIDAEALLPIDEVKYGFDNIGDALSVTPLLLERYLSAANRISSQAISEPAVKPFTDSYRIDPARPQDERMGQELPLGSRGGIAIHHTFPADGDYVLKVTLQKNSRGYVRGLFETHFLDVRVDGRRVSLIPFGGGEAMKVPGPPFAQANLLGNDESEIYQLGGVERLFDVHFRAGAGERLMTVTFLDEQLVPEGVARPPMTQFDVVQFKGGVPMVDTVDISGPFGATSQERAAIYDKIMVCRPTRPAEDTRCARTILGRLARLAYRRPVTDADMRTLMALFASERAASGFDAGIRAGLRRILVGPEFLFRFESDPPSAAPGSPYRLSDLALASRLSFFLWSSIPDDELLSLAENRTLSEPAVWERQVRRMLADPRSSALVTSFVAQWLYLRNLSASRPDPELFVDFDESLRAAFRQETELFVGSTLAEDRSVLRLLDADYTYLNERLAKHYGIPGIYGSHMRRVTLPPAFAARRGLLGQGSLQTVTSYANRTSVVLRGKWILENLLGTPPPPPPPNVPALEATGAPGAMPLRQLMERHRANPACRSCHAQMDPLGFALENFNAVGKWRTEDAGAPVDTASVLQDGTAVDGPAGLRNALLHRPEQFVGTLVDRLLTYSAGRGLDYYDRPAIRAIVRAAARDDYRWSSVILATVNSAPFQMKRAEQP